MCPSLMVLLLQHFPLQWYRIASDGLPSRPDLPVFCTYVTAYAEIGLLSKIFFFDFSPASALIMSDPAV